MAAACGDEPHLKWHSRGKCSTLKHMAEVGIRALKQNASAVVARVAAGERVTITGSRRAGRAADADSGVTTRAVGRSWSRPTGEASPR